MIYRDNNNDIRDSWAGISNNQGISFTGGMNVDMNNWVINYCPATGPDGVIIGDTLHSVFMSEASGTSKVYRSASSISNLTSQTSQLLTGNIAGLNMQNYPRIDRNGSAIAIVWKQNVNGLDQLPILFTNNISSRFPVNYDLVDLNDITNADVALSNGNIYVVWEDDNSGTVKFRKGTHTPATSLNDLTANLLSIYPNPSSGLINISSSDIIIGIRITRLTGDIIYHLRPDSKNYSLQVDKPGIYILTLTIDKLTISRKLIVYN